MSSVDSSCGWIWSSFQIFYWSMKVKPFMYQSIWLRERSWNFAVGELKHFLFACKQTFVLILLDNIPNVVLCHAESSETSQWWGFGKNYPNTKTTPHRGDTKTKASSVWNKLLAWEYTSCKARWGLLGCSTVKLKVGLYCWIDVPGLLCNWQWNSPFPCC